jgi:hypothetical protein
MDINRAWETIRENIKISSEGSTNYYDLTQQKTLFNERHSKAFDRRKQGKLQWA